MIDLLIIGGGINGVGIARDAAGRGLSVVLCEKDDLAQHTSSSSTKLIHGGLRYLEHFEFRLVRESLIEREILLAAAPHIIWPLRFVLPYDKGLRPAWMLRIGLFLYDHIGGRKLLAPARRLSLLAAPHEGVLQDRLRTGFEYSDCWVEDARLVVLNAVDARANGADIRSRTHCTSLLQQGTHWTATLTGRDGSTETINARAVVNAAGPWVDDVINQTRSGRNKRQVRLVKGSHIVTCKLYEGDHCYIFQNKDNRIIFAIPYEENYTLVGTTDQSFDGDRNDIEISDEETSYLCKAASEYFKIPVSTEDIAWTYAGVRPLYEEGGGQSNSTVTRDYVFDIDAGEAEAPFLSIFGGKITTYRKLAEHALEKLGPFFSGIGLPWTAAASLPGGDIADADFTGFLDGVRGLYPWLPAKLARRLGRHYGTRIHDLLGNAGALDELGMDFGAGLYEREVRYLIEQEFVQEAGDILWRRTKLGLHMTPEEQTALITWFEAAFKA